MAKGSSLNLKKGTIKTLFPRNTPIQFRNVNVGMFSGPRPSYQRYSVGATSTGILKRTGTDDQPNR